MPQIKRVTLSGVVLEQEVFSVAPNTRNLRAAEPKPENMLTEEDKERHNTHKSLRKFIRNVNASFGNFTADNPAYYSTHTFNDECLPKDFAAARRVIDNYIRRLQYQLPHVIIVAVIGRGRRTDRIHAHFITMGADMNVICKKWKHGKVTRIEPLREHNYYDGKDHGRDYTGLATYLHNHWTPEQGSGRRWRQTKTIVQPKRRKPTKPKRIYTREKAPITPAGYMLVKSCKCSVCGSDYLYYKYVKIPPPPDEVGINMRC